MNTNRESNREIEIFSTCPQSSGSPWSTYRQRVIEVAQWSEEHGCRGILVYSDNSAIDAWLVSQIIIENTAYICPLVAVQPVYMHPYTVAKMVATFGYLYGRRVYLNMVAGGFKNDLAALHDPTPHDMRYARLIEYAAIVTQLLASPEPVSYKGSFYRVENLRMTPSLDPGLLPGIFVSGSSEAGLEAARVLGATAVKYPEPPGNEAALATAAGSSFGIRVGIIAREDEDVAWEIAERRFPEDRKGQLTHQLAMKVSDSAWHEHLATAAKLNRGRRHPYWLRPFENYRSFCPYLVGSYDRVAEELGRYIVLGHRTFILDIPASREELEQIQIVFERATRIECPGSA